MQKNAKSYKNAFKGSYVLQNVVERLGFSSPDMWFKQVELGISLGVHMRRNRQHVVRAVKNDAIQLFEQIDLTNSVLDWLEHRWNTEDLIGDGPSIPSKTSRVVEDLFRDHLDPSMVEVWKMMDASFTKMVNAMDSLVDLQGLPRTAQTIRLLADSPVARKFSKSAQMNALLSEVQHYQATMPFRGRHVQTYAEFAERDRAVRLNCFALAFEIPYMNRALQGCIGSLASLNPNNLNAKPIQTTLRLVQWKLRKHFALPNGSFVSMAIGAARQGLIDATQIVIDGKLNIQAATQYLKFVTRDDIMRLVEDEWFRKAHRFY